MAQNPKYTRAARKLDAMCDRVGMQIINQVRSEDYSSNRPITRKNKAWRKTWLTRWREKKIQTRIRAANLAKRGK